MSEPHKDAIRVASRAFAANIPFPQVLKRAQVGRSTWWRMRNGKDFRASVIQRLDIAIDELAREQIEAAKTALQTEK